MNKPPAHLFVPRTFRSVAVLIATSAFLSLAHGAPALSGPSMVKASQQVVLNGTGFAVNSAVSISVTNPSGNEAHFSAVTGPDGRISYTVVPSAPGLYTVKVLSSGGVALSETRFHVMQ